MGYKKVYSIHNTLHFKWITKNVRNGFYTPKNRIKEPLHLILWQIFQSNFFLHYQAPTKLL